MKVWNGIDSLPRDERPVVATIGNYDGVHRGHRAILDSVVETARRHGLDSLLITFEPHPLTVVAPDRTFARIQTRQQKIDALEAAQLDGVLILPFGPHMAQLSPRAFFKDVLLRRLRIAALRVGDNFRFGHERSGDFDALSGLAAEHGFDVAAVPQISCGGRVVSSSAIREVVARGEVETAGEMLGRPFEITGRVTAGEGRGRELCFPTANIEFENELIPSRGVYVTETVAVATRHASVTNVGIRPTFGGERLTVESHLLDFDGDLYREHIAIRFLARLRDEQRFAGADELADQIARDRAAAAAYFHNPQLATS